MNEEWPLNVPGQSLIEIMAVTHEGFPAILILKPAISWKLSRFHLGFRHA
jgi:hypothetical protein